MPKACPPGALLAGLVLTTVSSLAAQRAPGVHAARRAAGEAAAQAIHSWVEGFVSGRITPRDEVMFGLPAGHEYIRIALSGGALQAPARRTRTTHFSLLNRLVGAAERYPSTAVAEALLALSAAGYSRDLYSPATIMVRDLGHFALQRCTTATIWGHVLGVATGRIGDAAVPAIAVGEVPLDDLPEDRSDELNETRLVMRRVAAIRLLGASDNPVFRVGLEKCLRDADARIRFAAAESFGQLRDLKYLYALTRRVRAEPHPLVVMALLSAIERTLANYQGRVPIGWGLDTVRALLPVLGRKGWRNDMTIVRMVRSYPVKEAVPVLISAMRAAQAGVDPLLQAVNRQASPVLADEIFQTLRQTTGALLPADPNRWQKFWDAEHADLQPVAPYRKRRGTSNMTRGTFFGIPVVGREVVFVLDTSGSMREPIRAGTAPAGRRPQGGGDSRLQAAKEQTLNAVQGVPASTRFHLVTFAATVRVWNRRPIQAGPQGFRGLTESLGRVRADGGTNVFAALMHVLGAAQLRYGQQIKNGVEEVFLLSDGEPSVGVVKAPELILRAVREVNRYQKVRINTVFTGTGPGADFMRDLAEQNHGAFVRR